MVRSIAHMRESVKSELFGTSVNVRHRRIYFTHHDRVPVAHLQFWSRAAP